MIQIQQLKLKLPHTQEAVRKKALKTLRVTEKDIRSFQITRRSLDARKKPELFYVYSVNITVKNEAAVRRRNMHKNVLFLKEEPSYHAVPSGKERLKFRPVIIGTGPAGLFCGYQLAKLGYRPILLERGAKIKERIRDVNAFWNQGILNKNSNVQFGEGGAGTFSDGKLNTLVHEKSGRHEEVLRIFRRFGAPEEILYDNKPHIGTDILCKIVENMRNEIILLGGEVRFHSLVEDFELTKATDISSDGGSDDTPKTLAALWVRDTVTGLRSRIDTDTAVLAIGHSARDTFEALSRLGVHMQPKSFAIGLRMEHPQQFINEHQYGKDYDRTLPAAPYKLTAKSSDGRGVYTFCMCPGGYVVNASSEEGRLAVNGMSYSKRDGANANSAIVVTVTPEDFGKEHVLSGMEFQRRLEENAYREGDGKIPVQRFKDYCRNVSSEGDAGFSPRCRGAYSWANVRGILPAQLAKDIEEGIFSFDRKLKGFAMDEAVLSGVESRTSSPVRILRDDSLQSSIKGLYPCGEGAGYAGGITSAAMDGLKVTESIIKTFRPFDRTGQV